MVSIHLRAVMADKSPHFSEHQCDLAACRMAAFTAREPSNRQAFNAHWARIPADPGVVMRTVMVEAAPRRDATILCIWRNAPQEAPCRAPKS